MAKPREEEEEEREEEHRQLQSVMRFTKTQKEAQTWQLYFT